MNSDGDKLYMKIVAFDEICNFMSKILFIWSHLQTQIINILPRSAPDTGTVHNRRVIRRLDGYSA
jgi:hypothetical protein